jgi:PAS domain S-box-containing protein
VSASGPGKALLVQLAWRYGLAVAAAGAGFLVRAAFERAGAQDLPTYITFYPMVMLAAIAAGFGPGLAATALVAVGTAYWILPPAGFGISSAAEAVGVVLFCGMGLFMSAIAELFRRSRQKTAALEKELALAQSEQRYRSFVEASAQVVWTTNPRGEVEMDIPAWQAFTGQTAEQARGFGWMDAIRPEDRPRVAEAWRKAFESRGLYEVEYLLRTHDGQWRNILARSVPILALDGSVLQYIGTCIDITDRKRAEEALHNLVDELRRSNQELEQFAYITSHDLQEPLRQISSFTQLLRDRHGAGLEGKAGEYMKYIVEGATRMSALVQDLLTYSRVGSREGRRRPVACREALGAAMANLAASIAEAKAQVTHDELPTVMAEPTQLAQLFQNLIGNAIKFRRDGVAPEVHVAARRQGANWLLWIKDNGIGIDPQHHERVFLVFQRLHGRAKYAGTGIGLAICKKIVEQHGGKIWVESQAGQGATFFFTLPESA